MVDKKEQLNPGDHSSAEQEWTQQKRALRGYTDLSMEEFVAQNPVNPEEYAAWLKEKEARQAEDREITSRLTGLSERDPEIRDAQNALWDFFKIKRT
jgi:hypothetical protein